MTYRIMTVYGTRPEAIKVAPVIKALEESTDFESVTVVTGQHREMLDQVNELFGIVPDHDLDLFAHGNSLSRTFGRVLEYLDPVLEVEKPDAVIVQGDTTTSAASAIAAFHRQIPVVHLEAGLRTGDIASPFPEEANRRITAQVASLHLAPTNTSRDNLLREGFDSSRIVVTGNTVIDALLHTLAKKPVIQDSRLATTLTAGHRIVLVTSHRRENWGRAMEDLGWALQRLAANFPQVTFVLPLHRNPIVRDALVPRLENLSNVALLEPLSYTDFSLALAGCDLVLTDSGGVQEEAPSIGKPVLVLRNTTERPEAIVAGTARLVGTSEVGIVQGVTELLTDRRLYDEMSNAVNPYGNGDAAKSVLDALAKIPLVTPPQRAARTTGEAK